jgi:hypothetical protein
LNTASIGRADEMVALMNEGADKEFKDGVRDIMFCCHEFVIVLCFEAVSFHHRCSVEYL